MSRQKKLNALGVKLRVLENTNCPDCRTANPNTLYSVSDDTFHIVCTECNHQAEGPDFESALFQFDAMQVIANMGDDESTLLSEL